MLQMFIKEILHADSFKTIMTVQAMQELAQDPEVVMVHSQVLYRIYSMYNSNPEPRPEFFRKMGMYLYYERFECLHGVEYYYYIKFDKASAFYQEHKTFIKMLVVANNPTTLNDYIGGKDLNSYVKERGK